jgi:hypothetical protein
MEVRQSLTKFISSPVCHAMISLRPFININSLFLELKSYVLYCYRAVSVMTVVMGFFFLRFTEQPAVHIVICYRQDRVWFDKWFNWTHVTRIQVTITLSLILPAFPPSSSLYSAGPDLIENTVSNTSSIVA